MVDNATTLLVKSAPQRLGAVCPRFPASAKMGPSELRRCVLLLQDFLPSFHPYPSVKASTTQVPSILAVQ